MSSIAAAPRFSCRRVNFRVPGIGTMKGLLSQQPSERDLSGRRILPDRNGTEQIDYRLIGLDCLGREAGEPTANAGRGEGYAGIDGPSKEALAKGAPGNEADPEFFAGRQHFGFEIACPKRIFALDGGNRLNGMCAPQCLRSRFGKTEILDLSFLNQVLDRSGDVFDWHVRVNTVLIEQIDAVHPEALKRGLDHLPDMLRLAIEPLTLLCPRINVEAKLCGDDHLVTHGSQRFADEFLVDEWAIHFSGIEEGFPSVPRLNESERSFPACFQPVHNSCSCPCTPARWRKPRVRRCLVFVFS